MKYIPDIFYFPEDRSTKTWEEIIRETYDKSKDTAFHELRGIRRERIDYMDLEQFIEYWKSDNFKHNVFIHRRGYEEWKNDDEFFSHKWCIEVGVIAHTYYLFIYLPEEDLEYYIEKYNLITRNKT